MCSFLFKQTSINIFVSKLRLFFILLLFSLVVAIRFESSLLIENLDRFISLFFLVDPLDLLAQTAYKKIETCSGGYHETSQRHFDDVLGAFQFGEEKTRRVLYREIDHGPEDQNGRDVSQVSLKHREARDKEVGDCHRQSHEQGQSLKLLIVVKCHCTVTCLRDWNKDEIYQHYNYIDSDGN